MQTSGRVLTSFADLPMGIATTLTGVLGRVLLVVDAFVCSLLLFDALFSGLEWVFTHDRRALADAAGFLAEAAVPFTVTAVAAYGRERLRRALNARHERKLVAVGPWR